MGYANIEGSKYKEESIKQTEKEKPFRQEEILEISEYSKPSEESVSQRKK